MSALLPVLLRRAIAPALLTIALFTAGCASDEGGRPPAGKSFTRKAPLPALVGQESYFDGRIVAELKVGAMTGFDTRPGGPAGGGSPGPGEHRRGGHRGGGPGMGGGGHRAEGGRSGEDAPDSVSPGQVQLRNAQRAERMGSPPVMIHLRFTNTGGERVELVVADFLSPLGNFVVNPEKLTLDPGQTLEVEPMTSRLAGEIAGGEISLNLHLGGRKESRTITLKPEPGAAGAESAPRP